MRIATKPASLLLKLATLVRFDPAKKTSEPISTDAARIAQRTIQGSVHYDHGSSAPRMAHSRQPPGTYSEVSNIEHTATLCRAQDR